VIKTDLGIPLFGVNNRFIPGFEFDEVEAPSAITCHLRDLPLMPGTYLIDVYLGDEHRDYDTVHEAAAFAVEPADVFGAGKLPPKAAGPFYWPATWELQAAPPGRGTLHGSSGPAVASPGRDGAHKCHDHLL
jgi:hypothetical protein